MKKSIFLLYTVIALTLISYIPWYTAHADVGPKTRATFFVTHSIRPLIKTPFYAATLVPDTCIVSEHGKYSGVAYNPEIGLEETVSNKKRFAESQVRARKFAKKLGSEQYIFTFNPAPATYESEILDVLYYDRESGCFWRTDDSRRCASGQCHFFGFRYDYFRIAFYIPSLKKNGLFISNSLTVTDHDAWYTAFLHDDGIADLDYKMRMFTKSRFSSSLFFASLIVTISIALLLTLSIELFVIIIYAHRRAFSYVLRRHTYGASAIGTLITLPLLWTIYFFAPFLGYIFYIVTLILFEVLIAFFEGWLIYRFTRKSDLQLREALVISFLANGISFAVGWVLLELIDFANITCYIFC